MWVPHVMHIQGLNFLQLGHGGDVVPNASTHVRSALTCMPICTPVAGTLRSPCVTLLPVTGSRRFTQSALVDTRACVGPGAGEVF